MLFIKGIYLLPNFLDKLQLGPHPSPLSSRKGGRGEAVRFDRDWFKINCSLSKKLGGKCYS